MIEKREMNEIFELPLFVDGGDIESENFRYLSVIDDYNRDEADRITSLTVKAINNHDRLTEENQKLREAFSNLYETFYDEHSSGALTYKQDMAMLATKQLLTELKGGEDE